MQAAQLFVRKISNPTDSTAMETERSSLLSFNESSITFADEIQNGFLLLFADSQRCQRFPDTAVRTNEGPPIIPAECGSAFIRLSAFWTDTSHYLIPHCFLASSFENAYAVASGSSSKPKSAYPRRQVFT